MKKLSHKKTKSLLSIVIVSFNTRQILVNCLLSLKKLVNEIVFEVVVIDNASNDDSVDVVKRDFPWVFLVQNSENLGFGRANNIAQKYIKGEYVLLLNSDTIVPKDTLKQSIEYLENHDDVGAMTCKIILPDKSLDKDARRSFPSPWVSFSHFSGLDRVFPNSPFFAKYWYGYLNEDEVHEVDVLQGAFFLTRKNILDQVGWFDEDYFLDGEDIDLSWKIKKLGYKIVYYPKVHITHIKKASKNKKPNVKQILAGINSMEIFYKKRMWSSYPVIVNYLVIIGINFLKVARTIKYYIFK